MIISANIRIFYTAAGLLLMLLLCAVSLVARAAGEPVDDEHLGQKLHASEWASLLQVEAKNSLINISQVVGPGVYTVQGYRYSATVIRGLKGEQAETVKFQVEFSECLKPLLIGQQYLVFGAKDFQGNFRVRDCTDVVSYEKAKPFIGKLSNGIEKNVLALRHQQ